MSSNKLDHPAVAHRQPHQGAPVLHLTVAFIEISLKVVSRTQLGFRRELMECWFMFQVGVGREYCWVWLEVKTSKLL